MIGVQKDRDCRENFTLGLSSMKFMKNCRLTNCKLANCKLANNSTMCCLIVAKGDFTSYFYHCCFIKMALVLCLMFWLCHNAHLYDVLLPTRSSADTFAFSVVSVCVVILC